jgi:predicted xylan-binding protein with Ca-dependent carbohydrate-binding module
MPQVTLKPFWARVAQLLLGLLVLQPLAYVTVLTWARFVHIMLIAAGLGYLVWRERPASQSQPRDGMRTLPLVLGLTMVFLLNQFRPGALSVTPPAWAMWPHWLPAALVGGSLLGVGLCQPAAFRWRWADWAAVSLALLAAGVALGSGLFAAQSDAAHLPWPALGQILISLLLWFATTRSVSALPGSGWKLSVWVWAVLAVTAVLGLGQAAASMYFASRGDGARARRELPQATLYYDRAQRLAARLALDGISDAAAFDLAGVWAAQGQEDEAAAALGLQKGYVQLIPADAWEGPEGGRLYYLVSCWRDLILYPGSIEIRIFAHGDAAMGVWPLMQVKLGRAVLDAVFVDAKKIKAYSFTVHEPVGRRARLEITFLNDLKQMAPPMDRNLWIEHAEIHYRRMAWE